MKTIYLARDFSPLVIDAFVPGDSHADPARGDCRRLTAKRLCLASERMGKKSAAILGLLAALGGVAEKGAYDGRAVEDWYGLLGLAAPAKPEPRLVPSRCPRCGVAHYSLEENGELWNGGVCGDCLLTQCYTPPCESCGGENGEGTDNALSVLQGKDQGRRYAAERKRAPPAAVMPRLWA